MFALSEKSAEKKTKTGRLPIAHYKQKPAGSDLWPVNRCIPSLKVRFWKVSCEILQFLLTFYFNRIKNVINSCDDNFSVSISPVTWSFRNHSKMLIYNCAAHVFYLNRPKLLKGIFICNIFQKDYLKLVAQIYNIAFQLSAISWTWLCQTESKWVLWGLEIVHPKIVNSACFFSGPLLITPS